MTSLPVYVILSKSSKAELALDRVSHETTKCQWGPRSFPMSRVRLPLQSSKIWSSGVDTIVSPKSSLEMKSVSALSGNGLKNNSTSKGVY